MLAIFILRKWLEDYNDYFSLDKPHREKEFLSISS